MKNGEVLREAFLNNTIRLIGECGFEKATTKAIAYDGIDIPGVTPNEVYIYRLFGSKTNLYDAAFCVLDNELFECTKNTFKHIFSQDGSFKEKFYKSFLGLWNFLLGNEARCRCYVRYYYSAYFQGEAIRKHRKLLAEQAAFFEQAFREECDVASLVHTTFMTILDFAIREYNHDLIEDTDNAYYIFILILGSLKPYFRPELLED
jgi:hypothetical protein